MKVGDVVVIIGDSKNRLLTIGTECTIGAYDVDGKDYRLHSKYGIQWAPEIDLTIKVKARKPLPKISFCFPVIKDHGSPNVPYCECSECGRTLYEINFQWCPKPNCMVQPKLAREAISERLVTKADLHKLAQKEKTK